MIGGLLLSANAVFLLLFPFSKVDENGGFKLSKTKPVHLTITVDHRPLVTVQRTFTFSKPSAEQGERAWPSAGKPVH